MTREVTVTIQTTSAGVTVNPGDTRTIVLYRDGDPVPASNGVPAGGTTGQVLAKASDTDRDVEWASTGGAAVWGGIGGTLSNQTDLQAALDGKLDDISAGTADTIVTANDAGTILSRAAFTIATLLATARDRATHTGTQLAATISDFASAALAAVTWSSLTGKPSAFPPDSHTHPLSELEQSGASSGQVPAWNGAAWAPATPSGGLSEPLSVVRNTVQSSAPTAAASGEAKSYVRQFAMTAIGAFKGTLGDPLLIMPGYTCPMLRGVSMRAFDLWPKGVVTSVTGSVTASAHTVASIPALNGATAASANAQSLLRASTVTLRDGPNYGDGFLNWGLISCPDASYGAGATGAKINAGIYSGGAIGVNGNRPGTPSALLEYNTNQSDTNWQAVVHDGATATVVDTGLAFTAQRTYLYVVMLPRGGTSVYFQIFNLEDGTNGSAEVAVTPSSTALAEIVSIVTLSAVARNIRVSEMWTVVGGQL